MPQTAKRQREWYEERKADGLCTACGNELPPNWTTLCCAQCTPRLAAARKRYYDKKRHLGLCTQCGQNLSSKDQGVHCQRCKEKWNAQRNIANQLVRKETFQAYGGRCGCCGETQIDFLTLDHVNEDGAAHRRLMGNQGGVTFYRQLKAKGFPNDPPLQVLCWNCNCAKHYRGACPHQ